MKKYCLLLLVILGLFFSCTEEENTAPPVLTPYKRIGHSYTDGFVPLGQTILPDSFTEYRVINRYGDMFTYDTLGDNNWYSFREKISFGTDTVFANQQYFCRYVMSGDTIVFSRTTNVVNEYFNVYYVDTKVPFWK